MDIKTNIAEAIPSEIHERLNFSENTISQALKTLREHDIFA